MANLFERVLVPSEDYKKIPVHSFYSALVDSASGNCTKAEIVTMFEMDAQASTNLDNIVAKYQASTKKDRFLHELHAMMCLAEKGLRYATQAEFIARLNVLGD